MIDDMNQNISLDPAFVERLYAQKNASKVESYPTKKSLNSVINEAKSIITGNNDTSKTVTNCPAVQECAVCTP